MKTFHQFTIRVFQSWFEILSRLATSGDSLQEIYCDCRYITYIRRLSMYTLTQEKNARLWYYVYLHLFAFCLYCYLSLYFTFFGCCCCVQQLEDINRMNFMALGTITGPIFCCFFSVFFFLLYVFFFQTFRAPLFFIRRLIVHFFLSFLTCSSFSSFFVIVVRVYIHSADGICYLSFLSSSSYSSAGLVPYVQPPTLLLRLDHRHKSKTPPREKNNIEE